MIAFDAIRATVPLADFCQSRGMELRKDGPDSQFKSLCPLHDDKTPSFTVYSDGHYHCFGCGAHGDITNLCAALDGITLAEAALKLGGGLAEGSAISAIKAEVPEKKQVNKLSDFDLRRMADAAHRLAGDPALLTTLAASRPEWTGEAIRVAALDGDLGYEENCEHKGLSGPAIFFGYRHGIKARWLATDQPGKRIFRWLCGGAHGQCWRQSLLLRSHQTVFITEGETDTLTLLSVGIEECAGSLVVALAGASMMPQPEPFTGRDIVIVPDRDQAGELAEEKLRALINPVARSIVTLKLEGIING